eukprot:8520174-Alexandrium_andersonii.AAC.1
MLSCYLVNTGAARCAEDARCRPEPDGHVRRKSEVLNAAAAVAAVAPDRARDDPNERNHECLE